MSKNIFLIDGQVVQVIAQYLATRPWGEVDGAMDMLQALELARDTSSEIEEAKKVAREEGYKEGFEAAGDQVLAEKYGASVSTTGFDPCRSDHAMRIDCNVRVEGEGDRPVTGVKIGGK